MDLNQCCICSATRRFEVGQVRELLADASKHPGVLSINIEPLLKFRRFSSIKRSACCHKQYSDKRTYSFHTSTPSSVKSYGTTDQYTEPSTKNGGQITSFCNIRDTFFQGSLKNVPTSRCRRRYMRKQPKQRR